MGTGEPLELQASGVVDLDLNVERFYVGSNPTSSTVSVVRSPDNNRTNALFLF